MMRMALKYNAKVPSLSWLDAVCFFVLVCLKVGCQVLVEGIKASSLVFWYNHLQASVFVLVKRCAYILVNDGMLQDR